MTEQWIERDLAFAIDAARAAGQRAAGLRSTERWEGRTLADIGDQACDGYLQGLIQGRYPDDGILSEETADSPERLSKARTWIVDPLDGTREYSQGRHDWAVHVALTVDQKCALAAVALPTQKRVLWGVPHAGANRFGLEGAGELLQGDSTPPDKVRCAISRSHTPDWVEKFVETNALSEPMREGRR